MKKVGLFLILVSFGSFASASGVAVPEIDGSSAVAAVTLVSGALLVIRGRRKR